MTVLERLKKICKLKNTSLTALCIQSTGSKGNLSTWKNNDGHMRSDYLAKCADILGCTTDYLLGRDEISQNEIITLDETIIAYMKLDNVDKAEIKGTIKQMLKADKYSVKTNLSDYAELAAEGGTETRGRKKKKVEILE